MKTKSSLIFVSFIILSTFFFQHCNFLELDDLERLPSVRINTPISVELNRLIAVAQITNPDNIPIDAVGFEVSPNPDFINTRTYPSRIKDEILFTLNAGKEFELNQSYRLRAYLVLASDTIFSNPVFSSTSGITLSISATVRANEASIFGSIFGLPKNCKIADHGVIWMNTTEPIDSAELDIQLRRNNETVMFNNLGEKRESGEFIDKITLTLTSGINYIRPYAQFQGTFIHGPHNSPFKRVESHRFY